MFFSVFRHANHPLRVLAFFLSGGSECGKFITGADRRFFEASKHLRVMGVEIFTLEYESMHSEKYGQLGYSPIRFKQKMSNHSILNCILLTIVGTITCLRKKCDILYVANIHPWQDSYLSNLVAPYLVSCLCRKPLVLVFHHLLSLYRQNYPLKSMIIQKATCLAVSQKTAENVKEYFRVKDVHVVGNGIDDQFFNNDIQLAKEYDAVFVGRIVPDKGIFELLEAWHRIVTKMPSAKLLLIGGFDNSVKESVFEVLERFQLEDNVTFTGFVTDEELVRLLKLSRIFVLPSYNEGFGLAIAEAMASGLPCIISDIPALKEIYLSAVLYVEPKNVDSLVNAIFFLLSNPLECEEFQAEGRKLAERFLWKKVIVTELDILKSTCSGQNTKSKP